MGQSKDMTIGLQTKGSKQMGADRGPFRSTWPVGSVREKPGWQRGVQLPRLLLQKRSWWLKLQSHPSCQPPPSAAQRYIDVVAQQVAHRPLALDKKQRK